MGWTSFHTDNENKKETMIQELETFGDVKVIDSAMVGNTFYGAIKQESNGLIYGIVCLIRVNNKDYYNFAYKDMHEGTGPYYYDCPKRIINLLSPTTSEWAIKWRKKCLEPKQETTIQKLNKLPIGTIIEYKDYDGEKKTLIKREPCYQFKQDWWQVAGAMRYQSKKRIPNNFIVVR